MVESERYEWQLIGTKEERGLTKNRTYFTVLYINEGGYYWVKAACNSGIYTLGRLAATQYPSDKIERW